MKKLVIQVPVHDEDGNDLPPLPEDSPVHAIIYMLEYGRVRGFRFGPTLQVGDIIVQVTDTRTGKQSGEPEQGIFEEHGYQPSEG